MQILLQSLISIGISVYYTQQKNGEKKTLSKVQLDFILFWIYGEVPLKRLVMTFQIILREKCFSVGKPFIKQSKQKPPSQEVIWYNPKITVESRSE